MVVHFIVRCNHQVRFATNARAFLDIEGMVDLATADAETYFRWRHRLPRGWGRQESILAMARRTWPAVVSYHSRAVLFRGERS